MVLLSSTPPASHVDVHAPSSDAAVIARSLEQPDRFGELYDRHHVAVFRYVRSRLGDRADDVVGDTFAEAFKVRAKFDATRGSSCLPWLLGIATRMIARQREAEQRWLRPDPSAAVATDDDAAAADERISAAMLSPWLAEALGRLRRRDRDALLLHVAGELKVEEVAEALGVPVGTVKSRLHRARTVLAATLEVHR